MTLAVVGAALCLLEPELLSSGTSKTATPVLCFAIVCLHVVSAVCSVRCCKAFLMVLYMLLLTSTALLFAVGLTAASIHSCDDLPGLCTGNYQCTVESSKKEYAGAFYATGLFTVLVISVRFYLGMCAVLPYPYQEITHYC